MTRMTTSDDNHDAVQDCCCDVGCGNFQDPGDDEGGDGREGGSHGEKITGGKKEEEEKEDEHEEEEMP
ncbi:Hypothetical predicted protein [Octopus vulgaris]|uniref:Uncharacterized protein n=1 Tax=Octopus vulgaris TaxID=6645 RepID=A0AA36BQ10_OCTVU|nr:Hypothetical predicted protein [Octopus vulgaris]